MSTTMNKKIKPLGRVAEVLIGEVLTDYQAVGLAEGFEEGTEEQIIEAWQHLHDTRLAYKLQGWFGRTAQSLIEQGVINEQR